MFGGGGVHKRKVQLAAVLGKGRGGSKGASATTAARRRRNKGVCGGFFASSVGDYLNIIKVEVEV